jgi:ADP-ribosylglycohydrolase
MNNSKTTAMLWGAFYGDAYALGAHWIYDTEMIKNSNLDFSTCQDPISSYHSTKKAGDFTHYGDQMFWLLEHIAEENKFSLVSFGEKWKEYMRDYKGYIDGASKHTLVKLEESNNYLACGSGSSDLSVIGRMFPIIYKHHDSILELQESIKLHTIFTHMNKNLLDSSAFFSEVMLAVLNGADLSKTIDESSKHFGENVQKWTLQAKELLELDSTEAIKKLGQSCSVDGGFAGVIHLLLKYENDFDAALKQNVMAGGDSAARGMIVGAILGALHYEQILQGNYLEKINKSQEIEKLMKDI